jgi:glyoxylase-like metal-dependent hydrolase (beta-lactamase superfamily II)
MRGLLIRGLLAIAFVSLAAAAISLWLAHRAVDSEHARLPAPEEVLRAVASGEGPIRISIANTASQPMPRDAVLDSDRDPEPGAPYVMSHPSFVLEWADGRILLVDAGMEPEAAREFGLPIQILSGGEPIEPHAAAVDLLGDAAERVEAIVFTHLHSDHVGGVAALCRARKRPLRALMTQAQDRRLNHTTRPGRELLSSVRLGDGEAPCIEVATLPAEALAPLPGFPGVFLIDAGGHTPGSQIVVARVGEGASARGFVLAGDIVNHVAGIDHDVPKPPLYSLLVVPESAARLAELRPWLRALRDEAGLSVLVSHDEAQLAASGVPFIDAPARP